MTEENFRRILGFESLPILEAKLEELALDKNFVREERSTRIAMTGAAIYLQLAPEHLLGGQHGDLLRPQEVQRRFRWFDKIVRLMCV